MASAVLGLALYAVRGRKSAAKKRRPHLIPHFDLNKTVLVFDTTQKQGVGITPNNILAEKAQGSTSADGKWLWNGVDPTAVLTGRGGEKDLISFRSFVKEMIPPLQEETKVRPLGKCKYFSRVLKLNPCCKGAKDDEEGCSLPRN
jgi:hypothetical protein